MKMNDDFMKHFRWITPLLLAFSIYMLQMIYSDFRDLRHDVEAVKINDAVLKVYLTKKLDR